MNTDGLLFAQANEIDRLRAELETAWSEVQCQQGFRDEAEARLAAVIALCDKNSDRSRGEDHGLVPCYQVRAAATGDSE